MLQALKFVYQIIQRDLRSLVIAKAQGRFELVAAFVVVPINKKHDICLHGIWPPPIDKLYSHIS